MTTDKQSARDQAVIIQRECDEWVAAEMPGQWVAYQAGNKYIRSLLQSAWLGAWKRYAERDAWQPIATAPRDGTLILLGWEGCDGKFYRETAYWDHGDWSAAAGWIASPVTHWQPLPQPPKEQSDE